MADPVLTATLSGQRAILLSWTFGSNADFQVFWKSSVPAGQDMALLGSTNAFSYTTPDLEPSKTYTFYVRANVGETFFYSNTVELFVSCGKGVVLAVAPPPSPPAQVTGNIFVADSLNHRIVKITKANLSYVSHVGGGGSGSGNDQFNTPKGITAYGNYIYILDTLNYRLVKRLASDLSYVSQIGSRGAGDDQFDNKANTICTDGTYLYIMDGVSPTGTNCRIKKHRCSDLSFVAKWGFSPSYGDYSIGFVDPEGISNDGTYLYIGDGGGGVFIKHRCDDLSYVSHVTHQTLQAQGDANAYETNGSVTDGTFVWVENRYNVTHLIKLNCSDLSLVWAYGSKGAGDNQFDDIRGDMGYDGTYIYIADLVNNRIKKHLASDGSFVKMAGVGGSGENQFDHPYSVALLE